MSDYNLVINVQRAAEGGLAPKEAPKSPEPSVKKVNDCSVRALANFISSAYHQNTFTKDWPKISEAGSAEKTIEVAQETFVPGLPV